MNTPPSTIDGIKRTAKRIKKEQGVPLHEAQNIAAQRSGYRNFSHAQEVLAK